jgi:phenylacetate-coenzyme A ligase PaaK-like adenylate-forming protein
MLINPDIIVENLSSMEGIGEFQIVLQREDRPGAMDELLVRVETAGPQDTSSKTIDERKGLQETIIRRVQEAVSVRPNVEFVPSGQLYDSGGSIKVKRIVDLRPVAKD